MKKLVLISALTVGCMNLTWAVDAPKLEKLPGDFKTYVCPPPTNNNLQNYFKEVLKDSNTEVKKFNEAIIMGNGENRKGHSSELCLYILKYKNKDREDGFTDNRPNKIRVTGTTWVFNKDNDDWQCNMQLNFSHNANLECKSEITH